MRLNGAGLLLFLGVLSVVIPVVTLVVWGLLPGPAPVRWGGRVALLLAGQLAAVTLVAAAANDYGYFYGSWTGLLRGVTAMVTGVQSDGPVVVTGMARPAVDGPAPGAVRVVPDPGFSRPAEWRTRGRLETVYVQGPTSQLSAETHVYLPPEYFQPAYAGARFPVAEVLTGFPATSLQPVLKLRYPQALLQQLHHHHARPMVLVMLRSDLGFSRDTECTDIPGGPQVETYLAQDLPWEVAHTYRVQPTGWGVVGDSTGGYCAAKIAMTYPYLFRAAVSMSGYFTALSDTATGSLWGGSQALRDLNSPQWRMGHLPAPPVSLLVTTSRDEGGRYGMANSLRFVASARTPTQVSTIVVPHGGHNLTTWIPEVPRVLTWLSQRLPAAG